MTRAIVLISLLLTGSRVLYSQELRASISGRVTDPSGGVVVGASVTATNVLTNVATDTQTNESGRYSILFLQPGRYSVTAEAKGFKKAEHLNLVLGTAEKLALDIRMEVGQVAESVTVSADTPPLETESASRGSLVTTTQIMNIPNHGRNIYQLAWAAPGVIKSSRYWGSMENYALGNASNTAINGGFNKENETVMDGVTNTQPNRDVNFQPPIEAVAEMKVRTSNYDASYGRLGGGVVQITTKSGTNSFHGSMYEFNKADELIATPWVVNFNGLSKDDFRFLNNTFGFEVDGPIYLPKLFDGRNRLFFMVGYEGLRERSNGADAAILPTDAQRGGDFSAIPRVVYDPLTTQADPATGRFVRTPFAQNRMPASRINNVSTEVLKWVPKPTRPELSYGEYNYFATNGAGNGYDQFLTKLDYQLNERNKVYLSYGRLPYQEWDDILFGGGSPAEPSSENPLHRNFYRWVFDWTSTVNPTNLVNFRWGLARYINIGGSPPAAGFDPRQLGFAGALVSQFRFLNYPRFEVANYANIGTDRPKSQGVNDSYSYQLNWNRMQGLHQLKMGAEYRIYNQSSQSPGYASGRYQFNKGFTQADPARSDNVSGDDLATFLLGYPAGGQVDLTIDPYYRAHYYSWFVHDDFKIHPRVTLNLGVRWDYEQPFAERYNRMVRGFAFDQPSPIAAQVQGLSLKGGLLYAGTGGDARRAFKTDMNNFQPRIGVAFQLTKNWVLRGGYGLFYLGQNSVGAATGYSQSTPLVSSTDGGNTPRANLTNAFPEGLIQPFGNSQGLSTLLGQGLSFQYLDRPLPYSHQYSFGLQRLLPGGIVVEASYSGNETRRYPVSAGINVLPVSELGKPDTYYRERIPNPMAGLLPLNAAKNAATITRQDLLLPFPQYTSLTISDIPIGRNHYHALQMLLAKRYAHGMTLNLSYTIAKTLEERTFLNNQDFSLADIDASRLEKRLFEYDVPQKLAVLWTYELPFGRNRQFGSGLRGPLNKIVSGWLITTQTTFQSGFPCDFPNAPNLEARSAKLSADQIDIFNAFDKSLFPRTAPNLSYALRTWPTRFPDVRLYPLKNLDVSLNKRTQISERVAFEIRADFLNAANHPWFSRINSRGTDVTRPEFGWFQLEEQNQNRFIALVAKLVW